MTTSPKSILALDVGGQRIGVARAMIDSRLPSPLTTLINSSDIYKQIQDLIAQENAQCIVLGLPRGLSGQETEQTKTVQEFGASLGGDLQIPLYWQDEAATSLKAKQELEARGKPYAKGDVDALAATYILEDFLVEHPNGV